MKITGMNPAEEIPPEHAHRAYYRQPVWKRIVVIGAGPAVNIVLAFVILWGVFMSDGHARAAAASSARSRPGTPAGRRPADGRRGARRRRQAAHAATTSTTRSTRSARPIGAHKGTPVDAHGRPRRPAADRQRHARSTTSQAKRYRFGFGYDPDGSEQPAGPIKAAASRVDEMWNVTTGTVSHIAQIFVPEKRKELGSVVGGYETTRQAIEFSTSTRARVSRSSRCRSASSTCSRSCRSTAGTSSGRWPRRCAAGRSRSASWSAPGSWASRS